MEFWHEDLMINKVVEVALQIRKKKKYLKVTDRLPTTVEKYHKIELQLLDIALEIQELKEILD